MEVAVAGSPLGGAARSVVIRRTVQPPTVIDPPAVGAAAGLAQAAPQGEQGRRRRRELTNGLDGSAIEQLKDASGGGEAQDGVWGG
jgi:hypothetical protein